MTETIKGMTAIETVVSAGQQLPPSVLDRSGEVLYSGSQTLRPGPIYLLGLNPGGNPNDHKATVRDRLNELPSRHWNSYQVSWAGRKPGTHRLQRGVQWELLRQEVKQYAKSIETDDDLWKKFKAKMSAVIANCN